MGGAVGAAPSQQAIICVNVFEGGPKVENDLPHDAAYWTHSRLAYLNDAARVAAHLFRPPTHNIPATASNPIPSQSIAVILDRSGVVARRCNARQPRPSPHPRSARCSPSCHREANRTTGIESVHHRHDAIPAPALRWTGVGPRSFPSLLVSHPLAPIFRPYVRSLTSRLMVGWWVWRWSRIKAQPAQWVQRLTADPLDVNLKRLQWIAAVHAGD